MARDPRFDETVSVGPSGWSRDSITVPRYSYLGESERLALRPGGGGGGSLSDSLTAEFAGQPEYTPAGMIPDAPDRQTAPLGLDTLLTLGQAVTSLPSLVGQLGDTAATGYRELGMAVQGAPQNVREAMRRGAAAQPNPVFGALTDAGHAGTEWLDQFHSSDYRDTMAGEFLDNPSLGRLWYGAVGMAPYFGVGAGVRALATAAASRAEAAALAGGASAAAAREAGAAAARAAATKAGAYSGGALFGGMAGDAAYSETKSIPPEQLFSTPEGAQALQQANGNIEVATEILARRARDYAVGGGIVAGAAVAPLAGAATARFAKPVAGAGIPANIARAHLNPEAIAGGAGFGAAGIAEQAALGAATGQQVDPLYTGFSRGIEGYLLGGAPGMYRYARSAGRGDFYTPSASSRPDPEASSDVLNSRPRSAFELQNEAMRGWEQMSPGPLEAPPRPLEGQMGDMFGGPMRPPGQPFYAPGGAPPIEILGGLSTLGGRPGEAGFTGRAPAAPSRWRDGTPVEAPGQQGALDFGAPQQPGMFLGDRERIMRAAGQEQRAAEMAGAQPGQVPDLFEAPLRQAGQPFYAPGAEPVPAGDVSPMRRPEPGPQRDWVAEQQALQQSAQPGETADMFGGRQVMPTAPEPARPAPERGPGQRDWVDEQESRTMAERFRRMAKLATGKEKKRLLDAAAALDETARPANERRMGPALPAPVRDTNPGQIGPNFIAHLTSSLWGTPKAVAARIKKWAGMDEQALTLEMSELQTDLESARTAAETRRAETLLNAANTALNHLRAAQESARQRGEGAPTREVTPVPAPEPPPGAAPKRSLRAKAPAEKPAAPAAPRGGAAMGFMVPSAAPAPKAEPAKSLRKPKPATKPEPAPKAEPTNEFELPVREASTEELVRRVRDNFVATDRKAKANEVITELGRRGVLNAKELDSFLDAGVTMGDIQRVVSKKAEPGLKRGAKEPPKPQPGAASAASPAEGKQTSKSTPKTELVHQVHDPMLAAPASAKVRGESGWVYRLIDRNELVDIRDSGIVRSRVTSDRGEGGKKYWTRGVSAAGKALRITPPGDKFWIRTRESSLSTGSITSADVELLRDSGFRPLAGGPKFSKGGVDRDRVGGMSVDDVRRAVDEVSDELILDPRLRRMVEIHPTPEAAGLEGIPADVPAAYHNGKVYLFADRITDAADARFRYQHEMVGHIGARRFYGEDYARQLGILRRNHQFTALMDKTRALRDREGAENLDAYDLAEEVLSDIAGHNLADRATFADRFLVGVGDVVARMLGADGFLSSTPMMQRRVRVIIANSRKAVQSRVTHALARTAVADGLRAMAKNPRNFQYQLGRAGKDFEATLARVFEPEDMQYVTVKHGGSGSRREISVVFNKAGHQRFSAYMDLYGDRLKRASITINPGASDSKSAEARTPGIGAGVYQALMHYAAGRGYTVLGDSGGLYVGNELRRSDAMLSAVLREGTTEHHNPSPWQFVGLLPKEMYDRLQKYREEGTGTLDSEKFGANMYFDLEGTPDLSPADKQKLEFLRTVRGQLDAIKNATWRSPEGIDLTTPEGQAEWDAIDRGNIATLGTMLFERAAMAVPELRNLYLASDGTVYQLREPVSELSDLSGARVLGEARDANRIMVELFKENGRNPAKTGVGVGTAMRAMLINSTHKATVASLTPGLETPLAKDGRKYQTGTAWEKLADTSGRSWFYSKGDTADGEYRAFIKRTLDNPKDALKDLRDSTGRKMDHILNPEIGRRGQAFFRRLWSFATLHDPFLMSTDAIRKLTRDTGLFYDPEALREDGGKGRDYFEELDLADRLRDKIRADENNEVFKVLQLFESLSKDAERTFGDLAVEASLYNTDPSRPWEEQKHLHSKDGAYSRYLRLREVYNSDKLGVDGRAVYDASLGLFKKQREDMIEQIKELNKDNPNAKLFSDMMESIRNQVPGPYFPLRRFGDHYVVAKKLEGGKEVDRIVTPFEREEDAKQMMRDLKEDPEFAGYDVRRLLRSQNPSEVDAMPEHIKQELDKLLDMFESTGQISPSARGALHSAVEEIYVENLPGMQAAKAQLRRRNIKGASADMRRAIAQAGSANAQRAADLRSAKKIGTAIQNMRNHAEHLEKTATTEQQSSDAVGAKALVNHIQRMQAMEAKDTSKFSRFLSQLGPLWYLATPSFVAIQPLQMFTTALPKLAARDFSGGKVGWATRAKIAGEEIMRAYRESAPTVYEQFKTPFESSGAKVAAELRNRFERRDDGKAWLAFREKDFETLIDGIKGLSADEKNALRAMNERNLISVTMAYEVMNIAQQNNPTWQKIVKGAMWPAMNAEIINRLSTGLAAYRMARKHAGANHADAVDYAAEAITDSQVDYSEANRPMILSSKFLGEAAPLGMFQMYRYQMLHNMTYYGLKSLKGDPEARRFLLGMLMTHGLLAGAKGLPLLGGFSAIAGAAIDAADDEDDPEYDPQQELFAAASDVVGQRAATALTYGAPAAAGVNFSAKLGLSGLWVSDYTAASMDRDGMRNLLVSAFGVPGSMAMDAADAVKMAREGSYKQAFETAAPAALKGLSKGVSRMVSGRETTDGYQALPPSFAEGVILWTGFQPTADTLYNESRKVAKDVTTAVNARRQELFDAYREAQKAGDREQMQEIRAEMKKAKIAPRDLRSAMRSRDRQEAYYRQNTQGLSPRETAQLEKYLAPYGLKKEERQK